MKTARLLVLPLATALLAPPGVASAAYCVAPDPSTPVICLPVDTTGATCSYETFLNGAGFARIRIEVEVRDGGASWVWASCTAKHGSIEIGSATAYAGLPAAYATTFVDVPSHLLPDTEECFADSSSSYAIPCF